MSTPAHILIALVGVLAASGPYKATAQEIDASKPTNFYTQLANNLEYNGRDAGGNIFGYRGEFILAPSEAHLILAEIPLLYNTASEAFGLGDIRARYFFLPYKNYDNFVGAFGPSVDVFLPTGSYRDGLGGGAVSVQPGVTVGLMVAGLDSVFPIISYQYTSEAVSDDVPAGQRDARSGINAQVIIPVVLGDGFIQVTPIYSQTDFSAEDSQRYIQELLFQWPITPTFQVTAFYRGIFADNDHTVRGGLVVFL